MLNKFFLITGATSGIGYATSEYLISKGATVYAIGRDIEKVELLMKNPKFKFLSLDLSEVEYLNESLINFLGDTKLDGFVNCAGLEETLPLTLYTPDRFLKIFNINVFAGVEIMRIISKKKFSNNQASFVFVSSVMGELGQPGKIGYCATKASILGVVKAAALELSKRKIRVNSIAPGVVNTPMTQKLFNSIDDSNKQRILDMHPLGMGEIDDVVPLIIFLLSEDSKWITGQNIKIDGGYSIQ